MKRSISMLSLGLILLATVNAQAGDMFLKSKKVTVQGVADVKASGGKAKARKIAIKDAQRNAVQEVMGALIESEFSAEQKETLKNNKSTFESKVQDQVYSKSKGFIQSQKVLGTEYKDGMCTVTIKATVKAASLKDELNKLQAIFKEAEYPKVMLLLTESYTDKAGNKKQIARPSIISRIENDLLKKKFTLVAKDIADRLRAESLTAFAEIAGTPAKAAEIASKYGAEVVVTGSSEVKYSAFNEMGQNMYYVSSVVNFRAINASNAKIMASNEAVGRGTGANEDLARVSAVKQAGEKAVTNIIDRLITVWQEEAQDGKIFRVVLMNVKNYGRFARPFMKAMKKLKNVEAVKELNWGGKRLELEVIYHGKKSELMDGIYDDVASKKKFQNLDKVLDRGNTIELTL